MCRHFFSEDFIDARSIEFDMDDDDCEFGGFGRRDPGKKGGKTPVLGLYNRS